MTDLVERLRKKQTEVDNDAYAWGDTSRGEAADEIEALRANSLKLVQENTRLWEEAEQLKQERLDLRDEKDQLEGKLLKAETENERLRDWLREAVEEFKFIRDNTDYTVNVKTYEAALKGEKA